MTRHNPQTGELVPAVVLHGTYHGWPWKIVADGQEWTLYISGTPPYPAPEKPHNMPVGTTREQVEAYLDSHGYGR